MCTTPNGRLLAVACLCGRRVRCSRTYRRFGRRELLRRTRRAYRFRRIRLFREIALGRSQAPAGLHTGSSPIPAVAKRGGLLLFECDPAQTRRIVRLAQGHWPAAQLSVHKDLAGQDRVVRIQT